MSQRIPFVAFAVSALLFLGSAGASPCLADFVNLGTANQYALLGIDSADLDFGSSVTVNGSVGVANLGSLEFMAAHSRINGNVYAQDLSSVTGPGTITGSHVQMSLAQAVADALNASNTDRTLAAGVTINTAVTKAQTFTSVNSGVTYDGKNVTVIDINGNINLHDANITLSGTPSDYFLINVAGHLNLTGTASLLVGGTLPINNVLWNFTGGDAANPGQKMFSTQDGAVVDGTFLAPYYTITLNGTANGAIIGGSSDDNVFSSATINGTGHAFASDPPLANPAPPSIVLFGLGSIGFAGLVARSRRRRAAAAA